MGQPAQLNSRASSHLNTFRRSHISERQVMLWAERSCQGQTREAAWVAVVSLVDCEAVVLQVIPLRHRQTMKEADLRQQLQITQVHRPSRLFRARVPRLAEPRSRHLPLPHDSIVKEHLQREVDQHLRLVQQLQHLQAKAAVVEGKAPP